MSYLGLEQQIRQWAAEETGVLALLVIGSRARKRQPADSWSDLDLLLVVNDPARYVTDTGWLNRFGRIWLQVLNHTGAGDAEWMILYEGGLKVDFILAPRAEEHRYPIDLFYAKAIRRGCRVLLNKGGDHFAAAPDDAGWVRPTAEEFSALCQQTWLLMARVVQMLGRGELWRARMIMDGPLRQRLLLLMEWHARASNGADLDTWYDGRFLADWLEPGLMAQVASLFAPFTQEATRRAARTYLSLIDSLGQGVAQSWGYADPVPRQAEMQEWLMFSLGGE